MAMFARQQSLFSVTVEGRARRWMEGIQHREHDEHTEGEMPAAAIVCSVVAAPADLGREGSLRKRRQRVRKSCVSAVVLLCALLAISLVSPARASQLLADRIDGATLGHAVGGHLVACEAGGGWQVDRMVAQLRYDLGYELPEGRVIFLVRSFSPLVQRHDAYHVLLDMSQGPTGYEYEEIAGRLDGFRMIPGKYDTGLALHFAPNGGEGWECGVVGKPCGVHVWDAEWDIRETYEIEVRWFGGQLEVYRDGELAWFFLGDPPLTYRYLFLGGDGNYVRGIRSMPGPIFSRVLVCDRAYESCDPPDEWDTPQCDAPLTEAGQ